MVGAPAHPRGLSGEPRDVAMRGDRLVMILTRSEISAMLRYRLQTAMQAIDDGNLGQCQIELERVLKLLAAGLEAPDFPMD